MGSCGLESNLPLVGLSHAVLQQQVVLALDTWGLQVPASAMKIVEITNFKRNLILPNMEQSNVRPNLKALLV